MLTQSTLAQNPRSDANFPTAFPVLLLSSQKSGKQEHGRWGEFVVTGGKLQHGTLFQRGPKAAVWITSGCVKLGCDLQPSHPRSLGSNGPMLHLHHCPVCVQILFLSSHDSLFKAHGQLHTGVVHKLFTHWRKAQI